MGGGRGGINFLPLKKGGLNRGFMVHTVEKSWCPQRKNAMYVVGLHGSLLPSFSDCWIVCTCCDTADSIRSSSLLNSSKQPQAPTWHRPTKIRPMAWKKKKAEKSVTVTITTPQVVETSVTVNNNSPIQDYVHPDDQTQPTYEKNHYCDGQI